MKINCKAQITKIEDGKETALNITFGIQKTALYDEPDKWFNAVVVNGFGKHPMVLLTNPDPEKTML